MVDFLKTSQIHSSWCKLHTVKKGICFCSFYAVHSSYYVFFKQIMFRTKISIEKKVISDKKDKLFHYIHKLNENFTIMTFVNKNRQSLFKEKISLCLLFETLNTCMYIMYIQFKA